MLMTPYNDPIEYVLKYFEIIGPVCFEVLKMSKGQHRHSAFRNEDLFKSRSISKDFSEVKFPIIQLAISIII